MKKRKLVSRLISLTAVLIMICMFGISSLAAEPELEITLPTGGVEPIEVFGEEVTADMEAEQVSVTASPYNARMRSYVAPSVPGYSTYGYNWLTTTSDPYVVANRAALVGLYEAFAQYSNIAWHSTADLSTLGQINVTALNIPAGSSAALEAADDLISLAAACFDGDNPQYYFIANGYSYTYYTGATGILYTVKPYTRSSYNAYSVRQHLNSLITAKYAEYETLAATVSTSYDKARIIHDKILAERDYAYLNGLPDNNDYAHSIIGVFDTTTNGPVCESYAKAYAYILNRLGVKSIYLSGLGNGGGHAWNMVELNGIWYYCDPTWDDRETTVSDPGNRTNDLYYMYYMRGSSNAQFFPAHQAGNSTGTNGWYLYAQPAASTTDLNASVQQYSYVTDNGFYGNAVWSNGGKYTVKNNYVVGYSATFDYYRNLTTRNFGTYPLPASGDVNVTGAQMHLFSYQTSPLYIRQLGLNTDFKVIVEKPYKVGQNRAWIYGIGNTFRGIDFGWVTLQ